MTIRFETGKYENTHGTAPRGSGMWAFIPNTTGQTEITPCLSFTEARRWIRARHPDATSFEVGA